KSRAKNINQKTLRKNLGHQRIDNGDTIINFNPKPELAFSFSDTRETPKRPPRITAPTIL
ncbi:MAG: hypothetical protein WD711_03355, partial [Dongiaceae bacterium]